MPVLIDTNVILDIVYNDRKWGNWSDEQITKHQPSGIFINPIIYAELCAGSTVIAEVDDILVQLRIDYRELPREALFLASKAFLQYRKRGGARTSPLADFFIGAQAEVSNSPILTRDTTRYGTYFPKVRLICP